jgi:hypothetical protein
MNYYEGALTLLDDDGVFIFGSNQKEKELSE